jgi:hypothetical protein
LDSYQQTAATLSGIPGGHEFMTWYAEHFEQAASSGVSFHDCEVIDLHLSRSGPSSLTISLVYAEPATVRYLLTDWIDVHIDGFSQQNVLGDMTLRSAGERDVAGWELGVGLQPGELELVLEPCFGANGRIRATIASIELRPGG